jgi:acyl carrier protein
MDEVEQQIARILGSGIVTDVDALLSAETPLVEGGLNLDSVNLLELLVRVEEAFGVTIEDEDISAELFSTLGSVAAFVRQKRAAHARPRGDLPAHVRADASPAGPSAGSVGGPLQS